MNGKLIVAALAGSVSLCACYYPGPYYGYGYGSNYGYYPTVPASAANIERPIGSPQGSGTTSTVPPATANSQVQQPDTFDSGPNQAEEPDYAQAYPAYPAYPALSCIPRLS